MEPDDFTPLPQNEVDRDTIPPLLTREDRKADFIRMIALGARGTEAARAAGIDRHTAYAWRREDPAFAKAWHDAQRVRLEALIDEAKRRALRGSDRLLEFLLCNLAPEQFSKREKLEVSGKLDIASRLVAARKRVGGAPNPEDFI